MTKPTILHFSTGRHFRGGERQVEFLHAGLSRSGMRSVLVCRKGGGFAGRNVPESFPLPWRGEWDTLGLAALIKFCKKLRPSVIHSHDGHSLAHAAIAGAVTGAPVVHTRRVFFPLGTSPFSKWKYRRCGALIGVSEAVARACKEALPSVRVHIVHDGVDWTAPGLSRADARRELGLPADAFVLGAVAYFTEEKNLALLSAIARTLGAQHPRAVIACVGPTTGPVRAHHKNMVFTGFHSDAARLYAAFDAFVSASPREGLGSALLDAVVRDIPCVAVDGGGTRDLFPEGTRLVAAHDKEGFTAAVSRIMDHYAAAAAKAAEAGARARTLFSIQTMVGRTIDVYRTVARP